MRRGLLAGHILLALVSAICAGLVVSRTGGFPSLGGQGEAKKELDPQWQPTQDAALRQLLEIQAMTFSQKSPAGRPWAKLFALTFEDGKLVDKKGLMTCGTQATDGWLRGQVVWGEVGGRYRLAASTEVGVLAMTERDCDPRWRQHMSFLGPVQAQPEEAAGYEILAFGCSTKTQDGKDNAGGSTSFEHELATRKIFVAVGAKFSAKDD